MNIVEALHNEESKLQRQLAAIQTAISALNGSGEMSPGHTSSSNGAGGKRPTSPAA